ncbi:Glycine/sarcosine/dimethylglycine N-methyltransferase [Anaerolineae bacterium]|nr:Glycine/sarcosine/dimethylglycine N-methyltransferase [Anaerolineae bacterium]
MRLTKRGLLEKRRKQTASLRARIVGELKFETTPLPSFTAPDDQVSILATRDRYGFPVRMGISHATGIAYLVDRLEHGAYNAFYQRGLYRDLIHAFFGLSESEHSDEVYEATATQNADRVVKAISGLLNLAPKSRLLDIGGSNGALASALSKALGAQALVIDPAEQELAQAAKRGLETRLGLFEDITFEASEKFDLIVINRAIEHIFDMRQTFDKINHLLTPEGYFLFDTADFLNEIERRGSAEAVAKIDHPFFLYDEMVGVFCARMGFKVLMSVQHQRCSMLYLCGRQEPQPARFGESQRQSVIRLLLTKDAQWQEMPPALDYTLADRLKIALAKRLKRK